MAKAGRTLGRRTMERQRAHGPGPVPPYWRPQTRRDCAEGARPCPFVGCRYHLALSLNRGGSIKFEFGDMPLDEMPATCALDVVRERGRLQLKEIAPYFGNIDRERIRQIEERALAKLQAYFARMGLEGRDILPTPGDDSV